MQSPDFYHGLCPMAARVLLRRLSHHVELDQAIKESLGQSDRAVGTDRPFHFVDLASDEAIAGKLEDGSTRGGSVAAGHHAQSLDC